MNYTSLCSLVLLLHIQLWMRNHWKGQRTVAVIPFSDVGILNPEISCALLSHHLVNSCRLPHNFSAAWSMGSKKSGLIPVLLYHVPGQTFVPCALSSLRMCTRALINSSSNSSSSNNLHMIFFLFHYIIYSFFFSLFFSKLLNYKHLVSK